MEASTPEAEAEPASPELIRDLAALRAQVGEWHRAGEKVAVVPTMGALHEGHLTLVRQGKARAERTIVTIFVNPKQFAPNEDLDRYPRDEAGDLAKLASVSADVVYAPPHGDVYAPGFATAVKMEGPAKAGLEDKFRPHFFDGVATVVAKLFCRTGADFAMFGEKDYQQLLVVRRMAKDLDIPIEVVGIPTVREADGLAMSSRNRYLSRAERHQAASLPRLLLQAAEKIRAGTEPSRATGAARRSLTTLGFKVDYVTARNAETLAFPERPDEPLRILAAAWLGTTRLIDNVGV
ncbi:MAG: pantoate--beta-alanine ligase [Hyphomicrobiales bacterium]